MRVFEVVIKRQDLEAVIETVYPNVLISYVYAQRFLPTVDLLDDRFHFFLDSGAHSANTLGIEIDIDEYMKFIADRSHVIDVYAGLDVIGDPVASAENQRIMEEAGFAPLPTYHFGEPVGVLEELAERYEFFCLGGVVGKSDAAKIIWLDDLYARVLAKYRDTRRIHMFGVGSEKILRRYPFYSADSSAGSLQAGNKTWHMQDGRTYKLRDLAEKGLNTVEAVLAAQVEQREDLAGAEKYKVRFTRWLMKRHRLQESVTSMWRERGIEWNDQTRADKAPQEMRDGQAQ